MELVPGDIYTSDPFSNAISHHGLGGALVDTFVVPGANSVKGLSFGTDGYLYAVADKGTTGYEVVKIGSTGVVGTPYSGIDYVAGNLSFGKSAFGADGTLYVGGQDNLRAFSAAHPTGQVIYTANQVYDVKPLKSGNLLVLNAYNIVEIKADGTLVRGVSTNLLTDARGMEYDPVSDDIFVTELGNSGTGFFRILRLDGATGSVEAQATFNYADDLMLAADGRLLVGSRTKVPEWYSKDLADLGPMGSQQQMFVSQMPVAVPEPTTLVLSGAGLAYIVRRRRPGQ